MLLYTAEHPVSSRSGESAACGRPQSGCDTSACNASNTGGPQRRRRRRRGAGPVETTKYVFAIGSRLDEVLDVIVRDDADAILVVPCCHRKARWHRSRSRHWQERVVASERMPGAVLVANNPRCFFGERFETDLLVLRTGALGPTGVPASDGLP